MSPRTAKRSLERKSRVQNGSGEAAARRTTSRNQRFEGVIDAVGGELYLRYWPRQDCIPGILLNTRPLRKVPVCYKYTPGDSELSGWTKGTKGYEDGGPPMTERRFPAISFDGEFPRRCSAGWIQAKNLKPYSVAHAGRLGVPHLNISLRGSLCGLEGSSGEEV
ncbi:hypothetical protein VUR80DRAFT_5465 [Thermomyces stellatus]